MKKFFLIFTILSAVLASCLNADYKDDIDCILTTSKQVSNSFVSKDQIESAIDKFFPVTKSGERLECSIDPHAANPADEEALLIAHMGDKVDMTYGNDASSASSYKLYSDAFPYYGYSCYWGTYDQEIVKQNLKNDLPVIARADVYPDSLGHCFVIDGYKEQRVKYTYYNEFVSSNPDIQAPEGYFTYSYSSPEITCIKINWGWKSQWNAYMPLNDGWFTLTANWVVTNGETYSYNHNVSMIYNFTPIPVY